MTEIETNKSESSKPSPWRKLGLEMGPLLIFFAAFKVWDVFVATGVIMIVLPIAMLISRHLFGHVAIMQKVSLVMIFVLGGLTIFLQDATFIYIKPTIYYSFVGIILGVGLLRGRSYLKLVLEQGVPPMEEVEWMRITKNFMMFHFFLAVMNELVWRNFSEAVWFKIKVFGFVPALMIFMIDQIYPAVIDQIERENSENEE